MSFDSICLIYSKDNADVVFDLALDVEATTGTKHVCGLQDDLFNLQEGYCFAKQAI